MTVSSFLARRRLRHDAPPLPPKMAAGVDQQTQSFSLSKSLGGQALYKIQASQVTNFKDTGKTILHDVSIEIYGKKGDRQDYITSEECEFDPASGALYIPGKVEMQLQAPSGPDPAGTVRPTGPIEVVTEGLHFNQNTGVASTDKEVRFRFATGEGTSQGAIYDPQDRSIRLLANARFALRKADLPASANNNAAEVTHVSAGSLRFQHEDNNLRLTAPVEITQGTRQIRAGDSNILLDEQGHARSATLRGGVRGTDRDAQRLFEIDASHADLEFTPEGKVRQLILEGSSQSQSPHAGLSTWASSAPRSVKTGQAQHMEMYFNETDGQLSRLVATGRVRVVLRPARPGFARALPLLPILLSEDASIRPGSRTLSAQQADMRLAPDGETLREIQTRSSSVIQIFPSQPGQEKRTIQGENFDIQFGPDGELSEFTAEQHVRVSAEGAANVARNRTSTSDHLWAAFESRTRSVSKMRQWGNFQYQDPERQARAERADYTLEGDVIVLQGEPVVWNPTQKITAKRISLSNSTGELSANEDVATTYFPEANSQSGAPDPVHVTAQRLQYRVKAGKALYEGNARLWQGSNIIEARVLELDRQQRTLIARTGVYSIFPGQPRSGAGKPASPARAGTVPGLGTDPVEIRSEALTYRDQDRQARYAGDVRMQSAALTLTSKELEIFFESSAARSQGAASDAPNLPFSGGAWQIKHAIAMGQVMVIQPTRKATGERAEFFPDESKIVLLGNLAAISDARRGNTQGTRLTYFTHDDRILVQGEPGSPAETQRQVRR
ncbi:MAG: LPS export ABC transporter periplasmic protein LptC [Acidobacteria bacterium]|nr:LPS export ABC transporter periplasmic protein LptC [Acidobacteriota bacterium]